MGDRYWLQRPTPGGLAAVAIGSRWGLLVELTRADAEHLAGELRRWLATGELPE